ncbi:glycosyltransferase [Thermotoga sp. KOL6]|uniref:glycosyltransferase n=1 Tax=Thermotoga sp. KOL6 TaxID=126741 RepID=UPI000C7914E8|nr:glycosyltransferase [Thermotoga sp. KOL6]PLV59336.1 glycosyl transferase family 1 [Thermotoga sp. KOL6]
MKRVLQLITRSDWAGGQKVLYSIVYGLKKYHSDEFEVEVACGSENGMLIPELKKIGVKVHIIEHLVREISPLNDMKAYKEIKKLIKEGNYDIVHTHSSKAGILGRIAARKCGVKKIVHTYHGFWGIEQYSGIKKRLLILSERIVAKYCDFLVFLCKREKEKAKVWKIGNENQYVIIPNAIIPEPPAPKGLLRKELNLPENVKIVGNVARLDPPKNPIRFLEVAKGVLERRNDVVFVWIGGSVVEDYYGKKVEEFLKRNSQMRNKVFFLPFRKDAPKLMADFDVFLLTSNSEGMPLVVLEAMNQGIPIVSTDVGCVGEMVSKTCHRNEELIEGVIKMLDDPNKDKLPKPSYEVFIKNYAELYRK